MKYGDARAFRAAIEARLRQDSGGDQDLARRRRMIAFDRFLARLAVAEHGTWVLKGGAALEFRMPDRARTTRDVDLALATDGDPVDVLLLDLAVDPFADYFLFAIIRRKELADHPDRGPVLRLTVEATLAGRVFERFVVDIVTAQSDSLATDPVSLGRALQFAELPVVEIATIDLRVHFAEKLSAYLRRYDDRPNTRVKDLVDLVLLIERGLAADQSLCAAVRATFAERRQELPSDALPSMAGEWEEPYSAMADDVGLIVTNAADAHALVEGFWCRAQNSTDHDRIPSKEDL